MYKWSAADNGLSEHIRFDLMWSRSFSKPLLSIRDLDLMNDGMQELVIVSLTGVHILQVGFSIYFFYSFVSDCRDGCTKSKVDILGRRGEG